MQDTVEVLIHSSIKINDIYIDPFKIEDNTIKAHYIFITHNHYDHLSIEDIKKIMTDKTVFVCNKACSNELIKNMFHNPIVIVEPNKHYEFNDITIDTTSAYNINDTFHKKSDNDVGYIINYNDIRYYIAGDTDNLDELQNIKCDIALVPIGGKYTMDAYSAASLINKIKPSIAIPTHYNCIVGNKEDEQAFIDNVSKDIKVKICL